MIRLHVDTYIYIGECCAWRLAMRKAVSGKQGWAQNLSGKDLAISLS